MFKLIQLEWKKNRIRKYIFKAVMITLIICLFTFALAFWGIAVDPDGSFDAPPGAERISLTVELFTSMAFLLLTSTMLASFIISAYKNKTMDLMFSYPIKRRKILASQMLAVWIFCFVSLILSKGFIYLCILAGSRFLESPFVIDIYMGSLSFYIQLIAKSFVLVSMGFISLFVGMARKSSKAAMVTSVLLFFATQADVGDFSMAGNWVVPLVLAVVSFGLAILSIWRVETRDLI